MEKWKKFAAITGFSVPAVTGEAAWTTFLVWATSKIPYIGIPIAITFGVLGTAGTLWIGGVCSIMYEDWYKEYCIK